MGELRSFSVKSLKLGDIPDDGSMSTMLSQACQTYKDSASLKEADGTVTEVYVEEEDFAVDEFQEMGQILLAFSIIDFTPETIQIFKGGTILSGGWNMSNVVVAIEKSVQIITKRNVLIEIPRAKIRAVINMELTKSKVAMIDIKAPVLLPAFTGLSALAITPYGLPVVDAGVDQSVAVATHVADLVGTAVPFRGTATYQWTVKSQPVASAAVVMATPLALANAVSVLTTIGAYVFTLTATDSNGISGSDDITVTITA